MEKQSVEEWKTQVFGGIVKIQAAGGGGWGLWKIQVVGGILKTQEGGVWKTEDRGGWGNSEDTNWWWWWWCVWRGGGSRRNSWACGHKPWGIVKTQVGGGGL